MEEGSSQEDQLLYEQRQKPRQLSAERVAKYQQAFLITCGLIEYNVDQTVVPATKLVVKPSDRRSRLVCLPDFG